MDAADNELAEPGHHAMLMQRPRCAGESSQDTVAQSHARGAMLFARLALLASAISDNIGALKMLCSNVLGFAEAFKVGPILCVAALACAS